MGIQGLYRGYIGVVLGYIVGIARIWPQTRFRVWSLGFGV